MKNISQRLSLYFILYAVLATLQPVRGFAGQTRDSFRPGRPTDSLRDGLHDFDFNIGNWHTHIRRLLRPANGPESWVELNGSVRVRKIWNGRAQLEEIEADGPTGHFEGMTLFLYNPASHQWSQNFVFSGNGDISNPTVGEFKNGRVELYSQETVNGRTRLVQGVWSDITPDAHRYTESLSYDGGKTWKPAFIGDLTRDNSAPADVAKEALPYAASQDGQHDFDFTFGAWKEHTRRLLHPLTGSTTWEDWNGASVFSKFWNGRGNYTELESDGPNGGHIELLALRLFNTETHQWYLTFATSKVGVLGMPETIGEFKNGRGEFYDQEEFNGRMIFLRFSFIPLGPDSFRSEQAFSDDGGKTWETNWINTYTRG